MVYEWKDTIVLITGAANGIGSNFVRLVLEEGAKKVVILDIDEKAGVPLQAELNKKFGENKVRFIKCDACNDKELEATFREVLSDKNETYVVINNAGILNDSLQTYKKEIILNVSAPIIGSLTALDLMRKDKGGKGGAIINISSVVALCPLPFTPIYNATKSAILTFSKCLGMDEYYLRTGVRVLTMCFGATDTGLLELSNMGAFDEECEKKLAVGKEMYPGQRVESAARGLIDMYKQGASGSTWMSNNDKPVEDITGVIDQAFGIMTAPVYAE